MCEVTQRLQSLIIPVVAVAKKHKVVDLSHSRPKKNTLKTRDVLSARGEGMKHSDQGLTPEVVDLAEFLMDITYSLSVWIEAAGNILSTTTADSNNVGLGLLGRSGLSINSTCGVMIASMALLYEHTIPLLERALANSVRSDKTRVEYISRTCRELLVQMMKTLMNASAELVSDYNNNNKSDKRGGKGNGDRGIREGTDALIGWDEVMGKLLSTGGAVQTLLSPASSSASSSYLSPAPVMEEVLRIIMGGGGLLADITRAYSTTFFSWFEQVFEHTDETRRQYIMTVLYDGEAGYLSPGINIPTPTGLTEAAADMGNENGTVTSPHPNLSQVSSVTRNQAWEETPEPSQVQQDHLDTLRCIYPDYGESFLTAVLHAFDNNPDRALDGLLTDNLPPTLTNMNRTSSLKIKAAFVGKSARRGLCYTDKRCLFGALSYYAALQRCVFLCSILIVYTFLYLCAMSNREILHRCGSGHQQKIRSQHQVHC